MIEAVAHNKVALIIERNICRKIELPTATAAFPDDTHASSCSSPPLPPFSCVFPRGDPPEGKLGLLSAAHASSKPHVTARDHPK